MGAAEKIRLEGKDWFTEAEAAGYCGVSLTKFREGYAKLGISPKRAFGRKLYARSDLYAAIAACPEWQPSTNAADRGISAGLRAAAKSGSPLDQLRPARQRPYVPRKRPS